MTHRVTHRARVSLPGRTEALATQHQDVFAARHRHGGTRIVDLPSGTEAEHLIRKQLAGNGTTGSCGW